MTDDQINARSKTVRRLSMMLHPQDFYQIFESFYENDDLTHLPSPVLIMSQFADFAFNMARHGETSDYLEEFFEFYTNQVKQKLKECR